MNNFKTELSRKIWSSAKNNFGAENFDEFLFGDFNTVTREKKPFIRLVKKVIKRVIGYDKYRIKKLEKIFVEKYGDSLERIFDNLNPDGQNLLVELIAYRLLGYQKVKLRRNNTEYWKSLELAQTLGDPNDKYDFQCIHFIFEKFDLKPIGYDIQLYFTRIGIAIDFIIEQYAYKISDKKIVYVEKGETVLDIGGCWGDTALYFAHEVGEHGKVYSFEFIPGNMGFFNVNISLNPELKSRIKLIENPVADKTGETIYYMDDGPGSKIEFAPFAEQTGFSKTITIDDFVISNNIEQVDFIKMDIEGAEPIALKGAIETIKKHRPKLAIAIYHSMEDFCNIPNWILDLDLGYEIYFGHYTIHRGETICFAKQKNK